MNDTVQTLIIVFPIILVSMSIHELMHALVSDWLGDDTARSMGRISLNPLKHIDPFLTIALPLLLAITGGPIFGAAKPVQVNFRRLKYDEFGGALVGAVGPLTNLVLAIIAALILKSVDLTSGLEYKILGYAVIINVGFFIFNSIPWLPGALRICSKAASRNHGIYRGNGLCRADNIYAAFLPIDRAIYWDSNRKTY
jgi:Zn-dependent protease